jgi:hypothetical protein
VQAEAVSSQRKGDGVHHTITKNLIESPKYFFDPLSPFSLLGTPSLILPQE